jgi:phage-related protein
MFDIEYYDLPDGTKPVEDFIDGLDIKMKVKLLGTIDILEEFGNQLREPYSKHLSDGIFELRVKFASDITRVLYFFYVGEKIILTNGFVKKTQKTPKSEIDKAKKYRDEYLSRRDNNE